MNQLFFNDGQKDSSLLFFHSKPVFFPPGDFKHSKVSKNKATIHFTGSSILISGWNSCSGLVPLGNPWQSQHRVQSTWYDQFLWHLDGTMRHLGGLRWKLRFWSVAEQVRWVKRCETFQSWNYFWNPHILLGGFIWIHSFMIQLDPGVWSNLTKYSNNIFQMGAGQNPQRVSDLFQGKFRWLKGYATGFAFLLKIARRKKTHSNFHRSWGQCSGRFSSRAVVLKLDPLIWPAHSGG